MKLAWIFGSSMAARHLLFSYLSVWMIQGGYCAWVAWHWLRSARDSHRHIPSASPQHDPS